MGMLRKRRSLYGNYWALNYAWQPESLTTTMKNTKKLKRNLSKVRDANPSEMTGFNIPKGIEGNVTQKNNNTPTEENFDFEKKLSQARAKGQAAIERRKKRVAGTVRQTEILTIWSTTCRNAEWASVVTPREYLKKTETYALMTYGKRFAKTLPDSNFREYLPWVLDNWMGLMSELFGWMTKSPPPEAPAALFLVKYHDKFEEVFLNGRAFDKSLKLTPEEREANRLVKSGMSIEDANKKARVKPNSKHEQKPPVAKSAPLRRKTRKVSNRRKRDERIGLPSVDENYYEEEN
jgi:hypothetical protein